MKDYHDLYLKCDVSLLPDVFLILENYYLRPSLYLSMQVLSWDAVLSITKVKLHLISNVDMHLFFGKGLRSSISYISKKSSKANTKYLTSYDPKKSTKYILYLKKYILHGYGFSKILQLEDLSGWILRNLA